MKQTDEKFTEKNAKIGKLKPIIPAHKSTINQLLVKCYDNEQYSRRRCLSIHGVEVKDKESEDDVMNTLEKCYSSFKCFI